MYPSGSRSEDEDPMSSDSAHDMRRAAPMPSAQAHHAPLKSVPRPPRQESEPHRGLRDSSLPGRGTPQDDPMSIDTDCRISQRRSEDRQESAFAGSYHVRPRPVSIFATPPIEPQQIHLSAPKSDKESGSQDRDHSTTQSIEPRPVSIFANHSVSIFATQSRR